MMKIDKIEKNIFEATGIKPVQTKDRQEYLLKVVKKIDALPDDEWDALFDEVKDFANAGVMSYKKGEPIKDYNPAINDEDFQRRVRERAEAHKRVGLDRNRYGIVRGSMAEKCVEMFEKGARMSDIKARFGSAQYKLLLRLEKNGHTVIHQRGYIRVFHKDDV